MDGRLKIKSLSDFNEAGDAVLTLIRADGDKNFVTVTNGDLAFLEARIAAARLKLEKADAKAKK